MSAISTTRIITRAATCAAIRAIVCAAIAALTVAALAGSAGCYIAVDESESEPEPSTPWPPSSSTTTPPPPPDRCRSVDSTYRDPACGGGGAPGGSGGANGALPGGTGGSGQAADMLPRAPGIPSSCPTVSFSRLQELLIVDPVITGDSRADDRSSYRPWSFRQRLEALVPDAAIEAAGPLADAWLAQWSSLVEVPASAAAGAARIPIVPRPAADDVLRCPWLKLSPDNGCDRACDTCRAHRPDLGRSPFRLLAIVNRADLGATAGSGACGADGGELRFIYGAVDPTTSQALPFTVIFEYGVTLRAGESLRDWVAAWKALGGAAIGPAFAARLDVVVGWGLARATLRRVLSNEVAFGAAEGLPWEMRQFVPALTDAGTTRLVEVATSATPRLTLASTPELGLWIDGNAAAVLAGDNPLPAALLAASAPIPTADFTWRTAARDPVVAAAFNRNTCNGCHGGRAGEGDLPFQHVAAQPGAYYGAGTGPGTTARLSRFLHDPGRDDELGRRERVLAAALCTPCAGY